MNGRFDSVIKDLLFFFRPNFQLTLVENRGNIFQDNNSWFNGARTQPTKLLIKILFSYCSINSIISINSITFYPDLWEVCFKYRKLKKLSLFYVFVYFFY